MITYADLDINNARLSFTENKNNPRFLDILDTTNIKVGDEVTITIDIKAEKTNHIQFNRKIVDIKEDTKEINTKDKGKITLIGRDYILQ